MSTLNAYQFIALGFIFRNSLRARICSCVGGYGFLHLVRLMLFGYPVLSSYELSWKRMLICFEAISLTCPEGKLFEMTEYCNGRK